MFFKKFLEKLFDSRMLVFMNTRTLRCWLVLQNAINDADAVLYEAEHKERRQNKVRAMAYAAIGLGHLHPEWQKVGDKLESVYVRALYNPKKFVLSDALELLRSYEIDPEAAQWFRTQVTQRLSTWLGGP